MALVLGVTYFTSLYYDFTKEEAIVVATLVSLAAAVVAALCFDSMVVIMIVFAAIMSVALTVLDVPIVTVSVLLVGLIVLAALLSVKHVIDSRDEIDYYKFFGSLAFEFVIIFAILKYGHLLWNYWQKF